MWYRFAQYGLTDLDNVAERVKKMKPYDFMSHLDMLDELVPQERMKPDASAEDWIKSVNDKFSPTHDYTQMHPEIYFFPAKEGTWRYLLMDPKNIKMLENPQYRENLKTPYSARMPAQYVYDWLHEKYPTALIVEHDSEEAVQDLDWS